MIPISKPDIGENEIKAVVDVLKSGNLAQGEKVAEFEKQFSKYCGTKYAVAVSNGTVALFLAVEALGIKENDEIITTPFSFIASSNCISYYKAKPVFADINDRTFNINPKNIKEKISGKTKAILPVHLYGQPCEMDKITQIAKENDLIVIEDACQAHGAEYRKKRVGSIGKLGCFSFYPSKNITTGEGGIITTDDNELMEKLKDLREHGSSKKRYYHENFGYNFRLTDIAAAIGLEQIKKDEKNTKRRIENAKFYDDELNGIVEIPYVIPEAKHVYHQYTIKTPKRDELQEYLKTKGIDSRVYYPLPIHLQPLYKKMFGFKENMFPISENMCKQVLSIPIYPQLKDEEREEIADEIKSFFKN